MEDDQPDARSTEAQPVKPKKWWQWVLVYPTFIIVLMGAVPTFKELYDSHSRDVDFGTSKIAEMRNEIWRKNMTCGMAPLDPLINDFNVAVDATICKSGDVLIRVTTPTKKSSSLNGWLPMPFFPLTRQMLLALICLAVLLRPSLRYRIQVIQRLRYLPSTMARWCCAKTGLVTPCLYGGSITHSRAVSMKP
ncbi:hypothetical protein N9S48_00770 [bacterium]|nr:hypothetical protein [bacterium]